MKDKLVPMDDVEIFRLYEHHINPQELRFILTQLAPLKECIENNPWHTNESVYNHTIKVVKQLAECVESSNGRIKLYVGEKLDQRSRYDLLVVSALLHDMGKINTFRVEDGITSAVGHEEEGAILSVPILNELNFSYRQSEFITTIIREHGMLSDLLSESEDRFSLSADVLRERMGSDFDSLVLLAKADLMGSDWQSTNPVDYLMRYERCDSLLA